MVEIHEARGPAHRRGAEHQIEERIALEMIEQEAQNPLLPKARITVDEPTARIVAFAGKTIRDGVAGRETVLQCSMDSTGRYR